MHIQCVSRKIKDYPTTISQKNKKNMYSQQTRPLSIRAISFIQRRGKKMRLAYNIKTPEEMYKFYWSYTLE
jgi:hypothetical protein